MVKKKVTKKKSTAHPKSLVIVESPAKAKTINRYLGGGYEVKASMGHVRDLPKRDLAVDITGGFVPTYEVVAGRKRIVNDLKRAASKAVAVYLATDLDREGEAIAWHLTEALNLPQEKIHRVVFNEITKNAIQKAFEHPLRIDSAKVDAQQARRILDRIVGYQLSPLLWRKVQRGLSAGRVQSVALRLIVEREKEIRAFEPTEYWRIHVVLSKRTDPHPLAGAKKELDALAADPDADKKAFAEALVRHESFRAELIRWTGKKFEADRAETVGPIAEALEKARYEVASLKLRDRQDKALPPFTTATLQQQASVRIYMRPARTMRVAQQLYEGLELPGEGFAALITYMRTDSTHLSPDAVGACRNLIGEQFGQPYLPEKPNVYAAGKRAQQAHEAIRPTDVNRAPESLRGAISQEQWKLYDLIWRRFVASQMAPARWKITDAQITAHCENSEQGDLKVTGRRLAFDGHFKVSGVKPSPDQVLPALTEKDPLGRVKVDPNQHFTQPPPRFTEASLVKAMEALGIGRPSTYAQIISTIQDREYVEQKERKLFATMLGIIVSDKLVAHFPKVMDVEFTAGMENELDKIEEEHLNSRTVLTEFYTPFHEALTRAQKEMVSARAEAKPSEYTCPDCKKPMLYRWGNSGGFLGCSGYPECKKNLPIDNEGKPVERKVSDEKCEKCGKPMILRKSRTGPFLGCSGYPECKTIVPCDDEGKPLKVVKEEDIKESCPDCGAPMAVRRKGRRAFLGCSKYPECKKSSPLPKGIRLESKPKPPPEPAGIDCDKCGKPMVIRSGSRGKFIACPGFPKCRNTKPMPKEKKDG